MADDIQKLYEQALDVAQKFLNQSPTDADARKLINLFLTTLLDRGYAIAPIHPTDEMLLDKDGSINDYDRSVYRKLMSRRPTIDI